MSSNLSSDLEDLSDAIYEAAVVPESWPSLLHALAGLCGTMGGALIATPPTANEWRPMLEPRARWTTSEPVADLFATFFRDGWVSRCDWVGRARALEHPGFVTDRDLFAPGEHERLPSYAFYRSFGIGYGAGLFLRVPSSDRFAFVFERRQEDGPVERATIDRLDTLKPHLARAALIACRLGLDRARAAAQTLAILGLPAAVLSCANRILAANEPMQALMPRVVEDRAGGRFHLVDRRSDEMLATALASVLATPDHAARSPAFSIPLAARSEQPAMVAHVVPVRRKACDLFASATSIVIMTPVCDQEPPRADVIQGLFDLTPAESRVARLIAGGGTVGTVAIASRTSEGTVRAQLKSVFAKTGVNRQAELVGLLNTTVLRRDVTAAKVSPS